MECVLCRQPQEMGEFGLVTCICKKCGHYKIQGEIIDDYFSKSNWHKKNAHKIIYYLNKFSSFGAIESKEIPILDNNKIARIINESKPLISQQYDNLILYVGSKLTKLINELGPNAVVSLGQFDLPYDHNAVGIESRTVFASICQELLSNGITVDGIGFSFKGWIKYQELVNSTKNKGYDAFMAMQFGDEELDQMYEKYFKSAVAKTGFNLQKINEKPEAGSIDLRLRNKIRNCRFLIADLTHGNNGSYWESGYAEGLEKPVIYTCRKDKEKEIHFDTNHQWTVFWDLQNIDKSLEELKNVIRYTIPESKQED